MGRLSLPLHQSEAGVNIKIFFLILSVLFNFAYKASAREIAGVTVAPSQTVDGIELQLNGSGLRTVTMLHVKAYVAAFYAPKALRTWEDVNASSGPLRFDFTFVRAFDKKDVTKAWTLQFRESASYTYPTLGKDVAQLTQFFGAIRKNGVETIEMLGDKTRITDDGVFRGEIVGKDFQKAFLSLWFGSNPVPKMKTALLGLKE
jgi:Chalcone isomerase-like